MDFLLVSRKPRQAGALWTSANPRWSYFTASRAGKWRYIGDLYQNEAGYVFTNDLGRPIDSDRLSRGFRKIVKAAGLPQATLHSLRHCHASLMLADGASIKTIAERLGHSNPALTLSVYSHLLPGIQRQAVEALHRRLAGG